jgi:hypothetical protein
MSALARLALSALLAVALFEGFATVGGAYHQANGHNPQLILGLAMALEPRQALSRQPLTP